MFMDMPLEAFLDIVIQMHLLIVSLPFCCLLASLCKEDYCHYPTNVEKGLLLILTTSRLVWISTCSLIKQVCVRSLSKISAVV